MKRNSTERTLVQAARREPDRLVVGTNGDLLIRTDEAGKGSGTTVFYNLTSRIPWTMPTDFVGATVVGVESSRRGNPMMVTATEEGVARRPISRESADLVRRKL